MDDDDKGKGFWITILVVVLIWALFFHHDTYNGKTAQEWSDQYDSLNQQYNTLKTNYDDASSAYSDLKTCLSDNRDFYDYYGGYQYHVYDVSDVENCTSTADNAIPSDFGN